MANFRPALVAALVALSACQSAIGLPGKSGSPYAPTGRVNSDDAIDGLIVGHRLMEAGEYELALKAYYRGALEHGATVDVLSAIGSANLRLGRLGQAERILRRAIEQDETFVPAWNNLGVVLMEQGRAAEASEVFKRAFALDSGQSDEIRENLRLALAKLQNPSYDPPNNNEFKLVRRGNGQFLLLTTP
ncbi:tetratricopeptide repeat protein [Ostreiculturibacter nitratireducens]|uniref:tetratricopeptide repeat protein n=1 Tax=Ostreiculturibacter nitratireducens TaxID=3075226 RepID=UPI0031B60797